MAKTLSVLMCLVALATSAPVEDKFLPHFMADDSDVINTQSGTAEAAAVASSANASPIIITEGSPGKKVHISITKEIIKGSHAVGAGAHAHASGHANHAAHAGHVHEAAASAPARLSLDNSPIVIDNETMAGVLQQLLAGNIENVQAQGQPLALPPGGKPVAVIFSSAMHVVDLGNLQPAAVNAHHHHHQPQQQQQQHHHHQHGEQAVANHSSILESIMSPLMSLTHMGAHNNVAAAVPVAANVAQPMQMQPVIVMMPVPQQLQSVAAQSGLSLDASAQLSGVLQGLLNTKQQILANSLEHDQTQHTVTAKPAAVVHVAETPIVAASELVPLVPVSHAHKTKKININITKTKVV